MQNDFVSKESGNRPRLLWVGPLSTIGGITVITKRFMKDPQVHQRYDVKVQDQGFFGKWNQSAWLRPFKIPLGIVKILWNMLVFRPDIVHVHTSYGFGFFRDANIAWIAKIFGAKVVMTFHSGVGSTLMEVYYSAPLWLKNITQYILPRLDVLIANGESYKLFLEKEFSITNVFILPNPVDEDFVARVIAPYQSRENIVFFAGFLDKRKGVFDLLKAAEYLPRARFIIYGTAPDMKPFRKALNDSSARERIILDEGYGTEKVIQYMNLARVLALPSYGETLPLIMEEAIACGVPVVVTPVGVIGDYIRDGIHGHIIKQGDIQALVAAIAHILDDQDWANQVSTTNKQYGRQFLSSTVNSQMLFVYDQCLRKNY